MLNITLKLNLNQANIVQREIARRLSAIEQTLHLHMIAPDGDMAKLPPEEADRLIAEADDIRALLVTF